MSQPFASGGWSIGLLNKAPSYLDNLILVFEEMARLSLFLQASASLSQ